MTIETLIGFDSAWTDRNPGAISMITHNQGKLVDFKPPRLVRFEEATEMVKRAASASDFTLIALDQPTLVPSFKSMRPVERVVGSIVNAIGGGVQPANRSRESMFGEDAPVWKFLDRVGARENPAVAREASHGVFLIEVFPALALASIVPAIWSRRRAAKYNPGQRKTFVHADWGLVTEGIASLAQQWKIEPIVTAANGLGELKSPTKSDQDKLDALICLTISWAWRSPTAHAPVSGPEFAKSADLPLVQTAAKVRSPPFASTCVWCSIRECFPRSSLALTALSSHWSPPQNAAVRPAEAATCTSRSILWAETWVCAANSPIRCAEETARILADFFTRPMFMRVITGHTLARRCFETVVGAAPTWSRVPERVRQPALAAVIDGARPAFPIGGRVRLFRAQMSQARAIRHSPSVRPTLLAFTYGTLAARRDARRPLRAAQVRGCQVRASQVRASQVRFSKVRAVQVRGSQACASQPRLAQVRAAQVRAVQVRLAQVRSTQVRAAQVRAAQVR